MADRSKIEWTEATWNPIRGTEGRWHCVKVSQGCKHCYAERMNLRFHGPEYRKGADTLRLDEEVLGQPARWARPRMVFVCSMTDLFLEDVSDEWIFRVFQAMARAPQHTFQVLTKRAERMAELAPEIWHRLGKMLENVWLGVSVEDQHSAHHRIRQLVGTPAAVRWLSCEPLLGMTMLISEFEPRREDWLGAYAVMRTYNPRNWLFNWPADGGWRARALAMGRLIDWVVIGGESGPGHRPMDILWARHLVEQCQVAKVPVFVKQLGGWPDKRGKMEDWPEELRVREWPRVHRAQAGLGPDAESTEKTLNNRDGQDG